MSHEPDELPQSRKRPKRRRKQLNKKHTYLNKKVVRDLKKLVPPDAKLRNREYAVQCPLCMKELDEFGETLYIKYNFSTGFCHRCGSTFIPLSNRKKIEDFYAKNNEPTTLYVKSIDCADYKSAREYYETAQEYLQSGVDYLASRDEWYREHYKELGIRFRDDRVVVPFYRDGNVFFYQSRFIDPNAKPKYYTPPTSNKPLYICPISNLTSTKVILCEGVFGAMAIARRFPDYKVVAVLGSYVTNYQSFLLKREEITEFVLYFDHLDINYAIRNRLREAYFSMPVSVIASPLGDPEDDLKAGKEVVIQVESFADKVLSQFDD